MKCFAGQARRALVAVAVVFVAAPARANGRFPRTGQIVVSTDDPSIVVARATFGWMVTRNAGESWGWICETAVGYGGAEDPSIALTRSSMLAGLRAGLSRSIDSGCTWSKSGTPIANTPVVDLAVLAGSADDVVALVSRPAYVDGSPMFASSVVRSIDGADHFAPYGDPIDAAIVVETVERAPSDPRRVYVSGTRGVGAATRGVLLVSNADGAAWIERGVPLDPAREHAPFIAAVDPRDADRVYVRTSAISDSRLLVTNDAGQSFTTLFASTTNLTGFALSSDGARIFVGSVDDGLLSGAAADGKLAKIADVRVQCLAPAPNGVWIGADESSEYFVGFLDENDAVVPKLRASDLAGPIACAPRTAGAACASEWPGVASQIGAGARDAGSGADAAPATPQATPRAEPTPAAPPSSGGCNESNAPLGATVVSVGVALACAIARRRLRRFSGERGR